ncbi:hypothetical protein QAD02_015130 [Eretmocerus hayati]|uniref:Uncharacterized protein n=1 Tax=Eretmocerus hayati TaxID=131215 RepID=A0ACC2P7F9_9HYME|nr:hypothetical protein QAD02_015130 [Eretmocerus hayati]
MDNSDDGEDEIGGNETIDVDVMDFVLEQARRIRLESLPIRSKKHYTQRYNKYKKWCSDHKIPNFINEDVMLLYMDHLDPHPRQLAPGTWGLGNQEVPTTQEEQLKPEQPEENQKSYTVEDTARGKYEPPTTRARGRAHRWRPYTI